jgi:hypothetical protein
MLGLGAQEVLLLLILAVLLFGVPIGVILLILLLRRQGGSRLAELEAENRRLREQVDDRRGPADPDRRRT